MNKTLLKMALLTSIITPSVMAAADDSRQILALLQQMQTSLTQLHSKVDTLETRLDTLEQEKSSTLPKTQPTLATEPAQQTAALSSSIAQDTTPDHRVIIEGICEEIRQTYPWIPINFDPLIFANPQQRPQVISLLKAIKEAATNKTQLQNIRSRIEKGGNLYINEAEIAMEKLRGFLDIILSPHSELLKKLASYDPDIFQGYLSSRSLCAANLENLNTAIRSNAISINTIGLNNYKPTPKAEAMLIGLVKAGYFNGIKFLDLNSPYLNNLRDLAINMALQGNFKNIEYFNTYCERPGEAKDIANKVIGAKKEGKLDKLIGLSFSGPAAVAAKSDPESQELREGLKQLGVMTNLGY